MTAMWWGNHRVPVGTATRWQIGPLALRIERVRDEWRVAREVTGDHMDEAVEVEDDVGAIDLAAVRDVSRFAARGDDPEIELAPLLADRDVVSQPERPFYIPSGERITVYVGSPLWVRLSAGNPRVTLQDFPILRPSDTWFGSSSMVGELCYASRTFCRLQLDGIQPRPHRAFTAMEIHNQAPSSLLLERVKLPALYLSLYRDARGFLWTQDVGLTRSESAELAPLRLQRGAPIHAPKAELVTAARQEPGGNVLIRAFTSLFAG